MPWPAVLLWGAAALVAGTGVKKGYDAYCDHDKAKEIGEKAERRYKRVSSSLEDDRKQTQQALEALGKIKVDAFTNQIKHMVDMHKKFRSQLSGYDEKIFIENLKNVEDMVEVAVGLKDAGSTAAAGAIASLGAYGGALGVASSVAASGIYGAAATNATLAWLGGGALSAGGFGMAGGMVALGGIAVAPLLAIGGFWAASKAEEELTNARQYEADVDVAVNKMHTVMTVLKGIRSAAAEQAAVIMQAANRFDQVKVYNMDNPDLFKRMMIVGKGLKQILDVPVLKEDGSANKYVKSQCEGYLRLM